MSISNVSSAIPVHVVTEITVKWQRGDRHRNVTQQKPNPILARPMGLVCLDEKIIGDFADQASHKDHDKYNTHIHTKNVYDDADLVNQKVFQC